MSKHLRRFFVIILSLLIIITFVSTISQVQANGTSQILWGAFVGPSHIDTPAQFAGFGLDVGKSLSLWENFQYWDRPQDSENNPNFDKAWMDACRSYGAIPVVTWDPGYGEGEFYDYFPLIIAGNYDSYITKWAQDAAAWGHPFFMRFLHQTLLGFPGDTANQFAQCFVHVENIFRANNATNVSWIWAPDFYDIKSYTACYPGDQYVDWAGFGVYNWGDATTFDQMCNARYQANLVVAKNKPQIITEIGIGESSYKAGIFTDMLKVQLPNKYPEVKALVYWEGHIGADDSNNVESNSNALAAFQQGIALNYYSSNDYADLKVWPILALSDSTPVSTSTTSLIPTSTSINTPVSIFTSIYYILIVAGAVIVLSIVALCLCSKIRQKKLYGSYEPSY
jgi:hypothetical protein